MNVDDSWSDATSPTVSKPSKPPIDAHAIIASTSGVAENPAPRANRHIPATMQKATVENPHSEAATNTAVAIRSIEPNLVDNPCPVPAANTAVVSSMGFNSEQELHDRDMTIAQQQAMIEELDSSLNTLRMTLSSQFTRLDADGNVKFAQLAEEHGAALKDLQAGFGMLQAKLDREITRVNAEKEAQFATLMEKFEGALCQVEASRSPIQMQKEAEVVALAQKFEDALCQVEGSKSQIQTEKETEIAALAQKFEGALCQVKVLNRSQQLSHSTQP
ncbi:hypothetical protein EDC04DRAFT_2913528 [Pisolithus marmoratus]|nr:hypothetical protein EDC04DRAFT_2913528 [Pisolithus marmoratus]